MADSPLPLLNRASMLVLKGLVQEALALLEQATASFPFDPRPLERVAELYQGLGRSPDAIRAYWAAANLYLQSGTPARAVALGPKILALDPDHAGALSLARALPPRAPWEDSLDSATPSGPSPFALGEETMLLEDEPAPTQKASPVVLPPAEAMSRVEIAPLSPLDAHDTPREPLEAVRAANFAPAAPPSDDGAPVFDADFASEDKTAVSAPPVFWASQARRSVVLSHTPTTSNQQALIPLLSALPPAGLRALLSGAQSRSVPSGALLCEEGSAGDSCFIVLAGEVEVWRSVAGRRDVLARLSAGEVFGELAGLVGAPRCAKVSALSSVSLYEVSGAAWSGMRRAYPAVEAALWLSARRRLFALWSWEGKPFGALSGTEREALAGLGAVRELRSGERLVLEGSPAGGVWVLVSARAELQARGPRGALVPLLRLGAGDFVGWGSVVEGRPAQASAVVTRPGVGFYFPKSAFLGVVRGHAALAAAVAPWLAARRALVEKARRGEPIALGTGDVP